MTAPLLQLSLFTSDSTCNNHPETPGALYPASSTIIPLKIPSSQPPPQSRCTRKRGVIGIVFFHLHRTRERTCSMFFPLTDQTSLPNTALTPVSRSPTASPASSTCRVAHRSSKHSHHQGGREGEKRKRSASHAGINFRMTRVDRLCVCTSGDLLASVFTHVSCPTYGCTCLEISWKIRYFSRSEKKRPRAKTRDRCFLHETPMIPRDNRTPFSTM